MSLRLDSAVLRTLAATALLAATSANAQIEAVDPETLDGETEFVAPPPPAEDVEIYESIEGVSVTIRGLDKLTGDIATVEALVGESTMFERMRIDVRVCYERTGARSRESSAFLQIYDTKFDPPILAFSGWMFASSPALSAMDHARYDLWVLSCNTS